MSSWLSISLHLVVHKILPAYNLPGDYRNVMCDVRVVCILMTIIVINVVADIAVRDAVYSINNEKKEAY